MDNEQLARLYAHETAFHVNPPSFKTWLKQRNERANENPMNDNQAGALRQEAEEDGETWPPRYWVQIERSYDQRARMLIAFNRAKRDGADLDDMLQAAWAVGVDPARELPRESMGEQSNG